MENRYHEYIELPAGMVVQFAAMPVPDRNVNHHTQFDVDSVSSNLHAWLSMVGLRMEKGEYFYTPPYGTLAPHSDTRAVTDIVKLNWMYDGDNSTMDWYELKDGARTYPFNTMVDTKASKPLSGEYELVYSAQIGKPSLVNVGRIHGVRNGPNPRHVYCVILQKIEPPRYRLQWNEVKQLFSDFIKKPVA